MNLTNKPLKSLSLFDDRELVEMHNQQSVEQRALRGLEISSVEHQFTSTGSKIEYHLEAMQRFHQTGYASPIVTHIMPTDLCNLACSFCSVKDRSEVSGGVTNTIELGKIDSYLSELTSRGLKAVILSGGGEPTTYRDSQGNDFRDLISTIEGHGLELGLITNGTFLQKYSEDFKDNLRWVRVSLYPSEYGLGRINLGESLPPETTLGFSLIVAKNPLKKKSPRPDENILEEYRTYMREIMPFMEESGGEYLRIAPDCHTHGEEFVVLHDVAEALKKEFSGSQIQEGEPKVMHQHKMHGTPDKCFLGYFHPVLYADGLVYPCDSNILNDDTERRFKSEYSIASWDTVSKLYEVPVRSLVNTKKMCPRCVFTDNNEGLEQILVNGPSEDLGDDPKHVNFI